MQDEPDPRFSPGNIFVTPVETGFLIRRALKPLGHGPWWEFVADVQNRSVAEKLAQDFAAAAGTRAWIQEPSGEYPRNHARNILSRTRQMGRFDLNPAVPT